MRGTGAILAVVIVLVVYILLVLLQKAMTFMTDQAYDLGQAFIK